MVSEPGVARFVGPAAFARADAYQRQRRVSEVAWSDDRTRLSGQVRGSEPLPYSPHVRLRPGAEGPEPVSGLCDCPVGDRCKHVGALLLEVVRREPPPSPAARGAGWRRQLDPILEGLDPRETGAALGLWFELQPVSRFRQGPGRFARSGPRPAAYTVGVRPVARTAAGRWRRTGVSWRDVAMDVTLNDYDDRQVEVLRQLHRLLEGSTAPLGGATWLSLDKVRGPSLWALLEAAHREGVGLVSGGRVQQPLAVGPVVRGAVDVHRDASGLVLAPEVQDPEGGPLPRPFALIGEPATGVATWSLPEGAPVEDAVLALAPFAEPLPAAAHAVLALDDPIRVPADEEGAFLADHYRRLAQVLPVGSRDGTFDPPATPVVVLGLTVEHAGGVLSGSWWWRSEVPGAGVGRRFDLSRPGPDRDPAQERALLAAAAYAVEPVAGVADAATGRLTDRFVLRGMAMVGFADVALPALGRVPNLEVETRGEPLDFRRADSAPVVTVATRDRPGDRDWFDLDIDVTVGDDRVPIAEVLAALARGDDFVVLDGGVWFPLEGEAFERLRQLVAEARELSDRPLDTLRISRFQGSLWDDLAALGIVAEQSESWRSAVAAIDAAADRRPDPEPVPAGFRVSLRPYQQEGYDWLCYLYDHGLGGVLADDMGLGKTVQSLALISRAVQRARAAGERARFLVVAPTSVVPNWVAETRRCAPEVAVVGVGETVRRAGRPLAETVGDADVVVTSYALLRIDALDYAHLGIAGLLLDEAQFVKNRESVVHQRARAFPAPFKLALTGTPMENSLMDLWSVLSITAPGLFPSPRGFAEVYQRPIEKEGDADALARLRRRIRPLMLRRTKELVAAELPPKLEQVIEVDLAPEQRKVYDRYLNRERQRVLGLLGDFDRNRFAVFRALTILRQVALDAALVDPAHEGVPSTKLDLLEDLLSDALGEGHRILVFSQFTGLLARVRKRLDAAGVAYTSLEGSTRRRDEVIERFRSGEVPVFLISLKAGGFGLNLAEADYCVLLDPWWNPAAEAQAVDRAHRIGQTRPVHVYRLVARNTIEEKVMALKATKAALFDAVIGDGTGSGGAGLTADDVRELLG